PPALDDARVHALTVERDRLARRVAELEAQVAEFEARPPQTVPALEEGQLERVEALQRELVDLAGQLAEAVAGTPRVGGNVASQPTPARVAPPPRRQERRAPAVAAAAGNDD